MIAINRLADKVFGLLKGHEYQIKMFTSDGNETVDPSEARRFFIVDPGMMVTIDDENEELELNQSNSATLDDTKDMQERLKSLANEFLLNYTVKNFNKQIQPRDFSYQAKIHRMKQMKNVQEGLSKMTGSTKTSHQTLEDVRILVRHRVPVDENKHGARTRNIQAIFLEQNGERYKFPHKHLAGARAMARHLQQGGVTHDAVGGYIIEKTEQLIKLREFYRYVRRNKLINEDSEDIVELIKENVLALKTELKKFTGIRTYESIAARVVEQSEIELVEEDDTPDLKDMFTVKKFDEKFTDVLSVVQTLVQEQNQYLRKIEEAASKDIYVSPRTLVLDSVLEYSSDMARFGYKLTDIALRITENDDLTSFINGIGKKLCQEQEISAFERDIVENVLSNLRPLKNEVKEHGGSIAESLSYGKFFDKYDYIFL